MHGINKHTGIRRVHFLVDTMSQVEHMAAAVAVGGQYARGFGFDGGRVGKQRVRVEIALQRHAITDATPTRGISRASS